MNENEETMKESGSEIPEEAVEEPAEDTEGHAMGSRHGPAVEVADDAEGHGFRMK